MSSSELSELTSDVSTDDEANNAPPNKGKLDHYFTNASKTTQVPPPLKKKRPPSPPHVPTLEDNPDIALILMKALIIWALDSSEAIKGIIKESHKQTRHDDDLNQPLSVQPWGRDGIKRRYWLIEGQDDTHFRLYRETNPTRKQISWRSMAGTIEELRDVANSLEEDTTQASRRLRDRIRAAIPRFEAGEEKRRRRDYRLQRRQQFVRPEPGFSLYEGRTRGKRIKYTYSDEEGAGSDNSRIRSNRPSGVSTPAESRQPTYTASGRQVRSRHGGAYGEKLLSGQNEEQDLEGGSGMDIADDEDDEPVARGRLNRPVLTNGTKPRGRPRNIDDSGTSEESDHGSETASSNEWNGGNDDDEADEQADAEDDDDLDLSEEEVDEDAQGPQGSLVVRLRYGKGASKSPQLHNQQDEKPKDLAVTENSTNLTTPIPLDAKEADVQDKLPTDTPSSIKIPINSANDPNYGATRTTPMSIPPETSDSIKNKYFPTTAIISSRGSQAATAPAPAPPVANTHGVALEQQPPVSIPTKAPMPPGSAPGDRQATSEAPQQSAPNHVIYP
ncbi:uncharacterized protein KY384_003829 [Bacidia gigantensis]|uniref:uncharacterized protein n=1 Tax=Bacidia gigantensis TaxID=2732470 RepID=UPI001D049D86|nr:uncharacterized protein KY384_003829 [Bacidia gigantensis]KAG8532188.1 hypothetical protein KY384_003829 [Bacidia gigantensis]